MTSQQPDHRIGVRGIARIVLIAGTMLCLAILLATTQPGLMNRPLLILAMLVIALPAATVIGMLFTILACIVIVRDVRRHGRGRLLTAWPEVVVGVLILGGSLAALRTQLPLRASFGLARSSLEAHIPSAPTSSGAAVLGRRYGPTTLTNMPRTREAASTSVFAPFRAALAPTPCRTASRTNPIHPAPRSARPVIEPGRSQATGTCFASPTTTIESRRVSDPTLLT